MEKIRLPLARLPSYSTLALAATARFPIHAIEVLAMAAIGMVSHLSGVNQPAINAEFMQPASEEVSAFVLLSPIFAEALSIRFKTLPYFSFNIPALSSTLRATFLCTSRKGTILSVGTRNGKTSRWRRNS